MPAPVLAGAEAATYAGGPSGVVVIHGFTGSPHSMRPLAEAIARAGFAVELPRLPGHGTVLEDLLPVGWSEWSAAVEAVYQDLASRCDRVAVVGLSMGGALAV
jgi:carboxylesterase